MTTAAFWAQSTLPSTALAPQRRAWSVVPSGQCVPLTSTLVPGVRTVAVSPISGGGLAAPPGADA
jgi:hypothetical protein